MLASGRQCQAEKIYYKNGTTIDAEIVSHTKKSVWIKDKLGNIGIGINKIERIEDDANTIPRDDTSFLVNKIQELIKQKNYIEAERTCTIILTRYPDNIQAHYLRGVLNQKLGNLSNAAEDYNFLITHDAADAEIFNNLGAIFALQQKSQDAMNMFNQAIQADPNKAEFHNNLSELLLGLKDYDAAIEEYNKVIALEPRNTLALYNLGVAYKDKGDIDNAAKEWLTILSIKPEDKDAKNALAQLKK